MKTFVHSYVSHVTGNLIKDTTFHMIQPFTYHTF